MKRFKVGVILSVFLLAACATAQPMPTVHPRHTISAKEYVSTCTVPEERYTLHQFNAKVFRHKNCLGIDDLLSVVWSGERSRKTITAAKLFAIAYCEWMANKNPNISLSVMPLKTDSTEYQGIEYHMVFFELKNHKSD